MYDAIIVGLGPAGATAAYRLASKGFKVLGLDKESFPRYKSCGGCVSTKIDKILDFDISGTVEATVNGATFSFRGERSLDIISDRPVGYNVRREVFDKFLVDRAREAGAEVLEGRKVAAFNDTGRSVRVLCATGESFDARFLICADGASGGVARRYFGLNPKESAVSLTAEVPYDPSQVEDIHGRLFIDFGSVPYGYAWIFPKKRFLSVGIAGESRRVGGRIKECFSEFVSSHSVLKGMEIPRRVGCTIPLYYEGIPRVVKGRVLAVGDAGHMVDPFLGEGIYFAIKTAQAASDVVAGCLEAGTADTDGYQDWLSEEMYRGFSSLVRLARLVYNHPRLWYRMVEKDPQIMHRYYDIIRGEGDPEEFYRWIFSKVKQKPWKVLRGWVESRFM